MKHLLELQTKSRSRRKEGLFVIEGLLEIERAVKSGYIFQEVFYNSKLIRLADLHEYIGAYNGHIFNLSPDVYDKVAYRKSTGGIIAIAKSRQHPLESIKLSRQPLLLITEAVEKPGNIGALLRTADAAGVDALIICDPLTDLYNPNVIRSSIGGVFTTQVAISEAEDVIRWLRKNSINIYGTALTASIPYDSVDFSKPSAIVFGTESTGLSDKWLQNTDQNIIIPMQGTMDSLNVSVSAAIVVFEAARQRSFKRS